MHRLVFFEPDIRRKGGSVGWLYSHFSVVNLESELLIQIHVILVDSGGAPPLCARSQS